MHKRGPGILAIKHKVRHRRVLANDASDIVLAPAVPRLRRHQEGGVDGTDTKRTLTETSTAKRLRIPETQRGTLTQTLIYRTQGWRTD